MVTISVERYDPECRDDPVLKAYQVPTEEGATVMGRCFTFTRITTPASHSDMAAAMNPVAYALWTSTASRVWHVRRP